ncbi:MAG: hypothetical protein LIP03_05850 [Bacteroidales bacterium]|nr:hypothetical protein [Bacteroidales bacterium]
MAASREGQFRCPSPYLPLTIAAPPYILATSFLPSYSAIRGYSDDSGVTDEKTMLVAHSAIYRLRRSAFWREGMRMPSPRSETKNIAILFHIS